MASTAMSRAVVTWLPSGNPVALRKTVRRMPIRCATAVIISANCRSLPPSFSASATAASLPDATIVALIASRTVTIWPALSPKRTGETFAAAAETVILSSKERRPALISDSAT